MKTPVNKEKIYGTMLVLAVALMVLQVVFHKKGFDVAALALLLLTLIYLPAAKLITIGWLKFSELIGSVNSKVILTAMFFVFLTPIAFFYRLFNKDSLHLKKKAGASSSYYHSRDHQYTPDDFKTTF